MHAPKIRGDLDRVAVVCATAEQRGRPRGLFTHSVVSFTGFTLIPPHAGSTANGFLVRVLENTIDQPCPEWRGRDVSAVEGSEIGVFEAADAGLTQPKGTSAIASEGASSTSAAPFDGAVQPLVEYWRLNGCRQVKSHCWPRSVIVAHVCFAAGLMARYTDDQSRHIRQVQVSSNCILLVPFDYKCTLMCCKTDPSACTLLSSGCVGLPEASSWASRY